MRVNVFIRKENEEKWRLIPNKSEWVNSLLAGHQSVSQEQSFVQSSDFQDFLKQYSTPGPKPPHPKYGYPCCHKGRCKHWLYNELEGFWQNELTRETKDA